MTSELRLDETAGTWVIVAPDRARRPHADAGGPCPFCPGNEALTPPELFRLDDPSGGWLVRVVANKFPLLSPDAAPPTAVRTGWVTRAGKGSHEVVIESPDHRWDMAGADTAQVRLVIGVWHARYQELQPTAATVVVFRNRSPAAGTSLAHPHSQVVATPLTPPALDHARDVARRHFADTGRNLYADLLGRELADRVRIVHETERFAVLVPFAAGTDYETWILPRTSNACFADASGDELDALASVLVSTLAALRDAVDDPPYNLIVYSAPPDTDPNHYRWHIRIVPRLGTLGGFELGTGITVVTTPPEEAAARLRYALN